MAYIYYYTAYIGLHCYFLNAYYHIQYPIHYLSVISLLVHGGE